MDWREHMPAGMLLRSGPDWHLDPAEELTLEHYLQVRAIAPADVDPLPLDLFLEYAQWFQAQADIEPLDRTVTALHRDDGGFRASLADGGTITAAKVVAAPGIAHFTHRPEWADRLGEHPGVCRHQRDFGPFFGFVKGATAAATLVGRDLL